MRVIFFGTPAFAVPTLRRLVHDSQFQVELVVSQPDRATGRGRKLESPPVAQAARELSIPCYQPESLRSEAARAPLAEVAADVFVVAAFGLIFGPKTLALPRLGCVNVHASLLPRFRGAAPISAAIHEGDQVTGVTLMLMEAGLDTGPMLGAQSEEIRPDDTTESLTRRLADVGAELAVTLLPGYGRGTLEPVPQPAAGATLTRPLTKGDGWLDWTRPAAQLERATRAFWPWPRSWTTYGDSTLQVHESSVTPIQNPPAPGTIVSSERELIVACGEDALRLSRVQIAGGKPLTDRQFLAGQRSLVKKLGEVGAPPPQPPLVTMVREEGGG